MFPELPVELSAWGKVGTDTCTFVYNVEIYFVPLLITIIEHREADIWIGCVSYNNISSNEICAGDILKLSAVTYENEFCCRSKNRNNSVAGLQCFRGRSRDTL